MLFWKTDGNTTSQIGEGKRPQGSLQKRITGSDVKRREWTGYKTGIKAVEVSIPVDSCDLITVSNPKRWVTRAIHERVTHLTDEELIDFIKIVKDRTYAILRIHGDELNHGKVFLVYIVASH